MENIIKIIKEICTENDITFNSYRNDCILYLKKGYASQFISDTYMDLNGSGISNALSNKAGFSEFLLANNIPCVPHTKLSTYDSMLTLFRACHNIVIKPNNGNNGDFVYKCVEEEQIYDAISEIHTKYREAVYCPYYNIDHEYSVVMLNGNPELMFEKIKKDDWRHNLSKGASPKIIKDPKLISKLRKLSVDTFLITRANFVLIDIIEVQNNLVILEINSNVSLENFSRLSEENYDISKNIYKKAITSYINS